MKKLTLKSPWAAAPRKPAARKPRDNPRVPCGTVSSSRNKFVGATVFIDGKERKVIGCAESPEGVKQYATRAVGAKGTRYTPKPKRAIRDLKFRKPSAVKLAKHSKHGTQTPEALIKAFEKRYAKPAKSASKPAAKKSSAKAKPAARKTKAEKKAEFLARMAKGKAKAAKNR